MITEYMEDNGFLDTDMLIPTKEEMERVIKNISEKGVISINDEIVLLKMKFIRMIIKSNEGEYMKKTLKINKEIDTDFWDNDFDDLKESDFDE